MAGVTPELDWVDWAEERRVDDDESFPVGDVDVAERGRDEVANRAALTLSLIHI